MAKKTSLVALKGPPPPVSRLGFAAGWGRGWIIAGSVIIALLSAALIIGGVIWCCWCCWGKAGGCCGDQCPSCYCGKDYCWDCCCNFGSEGPETHQQYSQTKASDIW